MKEIKKSFEVIWYPSTKSKHKSYRINKFNKDGTFTKQYVDSGNIFSKGTYKMYKYKDYNLVIFTGKYLKNGKWEDYAESAITKFTDKFKRYNSVKMQNIHSTGYVKLL
jgi:hypothetical protein